MKYNRPRSRVESRIGEEFRSNEAAKSWLDKGTDVYTSTMKTEPLENQTAMHCLPALRLSELRRVIVRNADL